MSEANDQAPPGDTQAKCKILVVDDEPDLEHLMRQRLRRDVRAGRFELAFAHDGVEALEMLNSDGDIDMVLSDINMPRMDGLTLLEQIPSVDPNIRSVIVSAYGDMKNIRTAMNRGAFDFVTKPIDFADLRITIDKTRQHLAALREALQTRDRLVAVQNELGVARDMQQSILPRQFPKHPTYEVFGNMEAARQVGGDFFDIINLEGDRIGLAIADVSGKGVPAALFMMSSRTLLKGAAIGHREPGAALAEVNDLLEADNDSAMFVTVFYGVYDPGTGTLTYANGGHNPPIVVHPDGSSTVLEPTGGIALGVAPVCRTAKPKPTWTRATSSSCTPTGSPRRWIPTTWSSSSNACRASTPSLLRRVPAPRTTRPSGPCTLSPPGRRNPTTSLASR